MKQSPRTRPTVTINGKQRHVSRVMMERHLGRPLLSAEIVHHINGNPFDNRIENLQLTNRAEHMKLHTPEILDAFRQVVPLKLPVKEIVKLFETESSNQIAKRYGCSSRTILRVLHSVLGEASLNYKRTHCKHGHPFTPENAVFYKNGERVCRICRHNTTAAYRERKKLQMLQQKAA